MASRTKRLGLGGVILGGAVAVSSFSLSSCWAIPAYIIAHDAAVVQANGRRDAARIIADKQQNPPGGMGVVSEYNQSNYMREGRLYMPTGPTTGIYDADLDGQITLIDVFWGDRPMMPLPNK